jgi:hypothetical protein
MKKLVKIIYLFLAIFFVFFIITVCYFFVGSAPKQENIVWGVDFSQMQTESLKLDWKQTYLAILNDLNVKNIKIHTQWDWVEGKEDNYFFDDIDWQINQAKQSGAKIIYVVGMKTGRWPECHMPSWISNSSKEQQQEELLEYIKKVILRYKDDDTILAWQVENEPFFVFGQCPSWYYSDKTFLKKEVDLVKSLDSTRQVIVSDSGEQSMWFSPAKIGDVVGITMYREVWFHIIDGIGFNLDYFLPPVVYSRKAQIINKIFKKDVICIELQAEPWAEEPFYKISLEEQEKTMNLDRFQKNVEYAKETGLDTFYFWGAEWWYWLKTTQNKPEIWNQAKTLF